MLMLNRIRLVNWHYFHDSFIQLNMTTLIAGDNGSGKSTIIDAIQYALVADIRKIQFNAAATGHRTERTLEGYCRCKIGASDMEYYRDDTITHVILEFQDPESTFLAGVQVEAYASSELKEQFWLLGHGRLEDIEIYSGQAMTQPRRFREHIKRLGGTLCPTKKDYSNRLTQLLHVHRRNTNFNPYFDALIRSVSFVPLVSVDTFVCNYILEERQVDISAMKENLLNYKEAEREALLMEEKIAALRNIADQQTQIDQLTVQVLRQEYLEHRLPVHIIQERQRQNRSKLEQVSYSRKQLISSIEDLKERQGRTQQRYDEVQAALSGSDAHQLYQQYSRELEQLTKQLDHCNRQIEAFKSLKKQAEEQLSRRLSDDLLVEVERLSGEHDTLLERRIELQQQISHMDTEISELSAEQQDLRRGILKYPERTARLKQELSKVGIDAWVFADLLEVVRPEWQNAVEGWLNTQRFNILVEEEDFQQALTVYDSLPKDISGVGLPHLAKMRRSEVHPGSLAELVEASSPLARRYCAHLLGEVMMVTIDKLKEYSRAVTKECMRYANKTASRIHESVYSRWYIGSSARKQRLDAIASRLGELEKDISKAREQLRQTESMLEKNKQAVKGVHELLSLQEAFARKETLTQEVNETQQQLDGIDTAEIEELKRLLEHLKEELAAVQKEIGRKHVESGRLDGTLSQLEQSYAELTVQHEQKNRVYEEFLAAHQDLKGDFTAFYEKHISARNTLEEMEYKLGTIGSTKKGTATRLADNQRQIRRMKEEYNRHFNTYMPVDGDDSLQFLQTLQRFERTELPFYRDKIRAAREEAEHQFREHFVSRLNEYLIDARESFSELNTILKSLTFGQDQYSFSLHARPEKKHLLSVISGAAQIKDVEGTLFDQIIDPQQRKSIETLFDSILEHDLDSAEVREICDYRTYFTYDIRIKHTETIDPKSGRPLESSLSRSLREKSGGETQTPYYVAIAASFFRFFKDDERAIRLVLFDEAFNKMDDDRIGNMLNFFKHMGIQVLTAVPTEKIETIAPHVDRINLVLRKDYRALIREYRILDEEDRTSGSSA
ncbi:MAG: ATP-binding protein [Spirochaetota bacterium]